MPVLTGGNVMPGPETWASREGYGLFVNAGAPTNGVSGTLAGTAEKGALLIDSSAGTLYQNTNSKASPTWTAR